MENVDLVQEVKQIFIEVANLPELKLEDIDVQQSLFQEGLGLDSVDVLEFVVQLDRKYGLKIKNNDEGKQTLQNIQSVVDAIVQHRKS